ncbi:MAG TPA: hypothetical protein VJ850_03465 [Candidatus Limnocylindrales bacterium]|nr:hypothetical protein [Candidatus Limnocylindrales bacterium]
MRRSRELADALQRMLDAADAKGAAGNADEWTMWQQAATDYWLLLHPELQHLRRAKPHVERTIERMTELAEHLSHAMDGIPDVWRFAKLSDEKIEHLARVGWFHELLKGLYEPFWAALEHKPNERDEIELMVRFLEADVYCHRSGYMKSDVIRAIRRSPVLLETVRSRLQDVVIHVVDGPDRREFRDYIRLAKKVDDEELRMRISARIGVDSEVVARHARWMLDGLTSRVDAG